MSLSEESRPTRSGKEFMSLSEGSRLNRSGKEPMLLPEEPASFPLCVLTPTDSGKGPVLLSWLSKPAYRRSPSLGPLPAMGCPSIGPSPSSKSAKEAGRLAICAASVVVVLRFIRCRAP